MTYRGRGTMLRHKCKKFNQMCGCFREKSFNLSTINKTRRSSLYKILMSIISAVDRNLLKELPKLNRGPPTKFELNILQ